MQVTFYVQKLDATTAAPWHIRSLSGLFCLQPSLICAFWLQILNVCAKTILPTSQATCKGKGPSLL